MLSVSAKRIGLFNLNRKTEMCSKRLGKPTRSFDCTELWTICGPPDRSRKSSCKGSPGTNHVLCGTKPEVMRPWGRIVHEARKAQGRNERKASTLNKKQETERARSAADAKQRTPACCP
ncbi:hypothetical protein Esti_006087 [Eimeria stiedai]